MSQQNTLSEINFFICSTYNDLRDYRTELIQQIQKQKGSINAQEFFGARDSKPLATCIEEVEKSDFFIMIIGFRYGSIDSSVNKSFVELEYEAAKAKGIPKLVYFLDEEYPIPPLYVDSNINADLLKNFKAKLKIEHTISKFTSPGDLAAKVLDDLYRELPKNGFSIKKKDESLVASDDKEKLRLFQIVPKLYAYEEVIVEAKLGKIERAEKGECEAFSMTYGATLKRRIILVDENLEKILENQLKQIFASFENARILIGLDTEHVFKLRLRTISGEYETSEPIYKTVSPYKTVEAASISSISLFLPEVYREKERVLTGYKKAKYLFYSLLFLEILT